METDLFEAIVALVAFILIVGLPVAAIIWGISLLTGLTNALLIGLLVAIIFGRAGK